MTPKKVNLNDLSLMKNSDDDSDEEDNSEESQVNQVDIEQTFKQDNPHRENQQLSDAASTHESNQKLKGNQLLNKLQQK